MAKPRHTLRTFPSDRPVEVTYAPISIGKSAKLEVKLLLEWSRREQVLRKWAKLRLTGDGPLLLKEVILDKIDLGVSKSSPPRLSRSSNRLRVIPSSCEGFFAGIEFPIAATRMENNCLILAHRPGQRLERGNWYETRRVVFGLAPHSWNAQRLSKHRCPPAAAQGFTSQLNDWWSTPVRAAEPDILGLVAVFDRELFRRHGVALDSFCIDVGWEYPQSVWAMDAGVFRGGFDAIRSALARMKAGRDMDLAPSSVYPQAHDTAWSKAHGYETSVIVRDGQSAPFACLGGASTLRSFESGSLTWSDGITWSRSSSTDTSSSATTRITATNRASCRRSPLPTA